MKWQDLRGGGSGDLAIMLTGGGARAAYQVGLLRGIARHFPALRFQIVTGVSAGAINATFLAAHEGTLPEVVDRLTRLWCDLECEHVFRPNYLAFLPFHSALRLLLPRLKGQPHGLFDSSPLGHLMRRILDSPRRGWPIQGIRNNIASGHLHAVALIALDYTTGQSVRWVQGRRKIDVFEGPNRRTAQTELTVEHILASAALPFVFPAIRIGDRFYGDGGIRLSAPLSAAVHLGASRILAMSTGYQRTDEEAARPVVRGYPPVAQILGQLLNAIFIDAIDEDVVRMERINEMLLKLDAKERNGLRPIDLHVLRPSCDLGKLAAEYAHLLPASLKLFTRALGTHQTEVPDILSMLMFDPAYLRRLIEIGEADADARVDELRAFFGEVQEEPPAAEAV